MNEIWKDIEGYEGMYQVSSLGRVRSLNFKKQNRTQVLNLGRTKKGYIRVTLRGKSHLVHRLVAKAFLPQKEGCNIVNHIDENKRNNSVDNLEWCDALYNYEYSKYSNRQFGLYHPYHPYKEGTKRIRKPYKNNYKVKQLDRERNLIRIFNSPVEASKELNLNRGSIYKCVNGQVKTVGGFIFEKIDG